MRANPLILIVEDNTSSLDILRARLEAYHYDIITACDGLEGLAKATEHLPDLILLDIMMPKIDGLEVCRRLRKDSALPFIPIILVTAKGDSKDIIAGFEAGGDEYLTKPVDHTSLVARVKSMLRIKNLHDLAVDQAEQLKHQLETASKVQSLFLPTTRDLEDNVKIWTYTESASYVGGDLYDIISLPDGSVFVYVADICGKGVEASLIMAALSTMIRMEVPFHNELTELLKVVNKSMFNLSSEEGYFATIICGRYWPESGRLQLLRAGHPFPLWIGSGKLKDLPRLEGTPLGITPDMRYETGDIYLDEGDSCLFYSDGLEEAENEAGEMFGKDNLLQCMVGTTQPPWGPMLVDTIRSWRGSAEANDDTTILEITREVP